MCTTHNRYSICKHLLRLLFSLACDGELLPKMFSLIYKTYTGVEVSQYNPLRSSRVICFVVYLERNNLPYVAVMIMIMIIMISNVH